MEELTCVVERLTYHNPVNGYSVIRVTAKGYQDEVTVVGNMAEVHVGSVLKAKGKWSFDSKYGKQFSLISYEETMPATLHGLEKYLGGGMIRGVGPKFAKKIVDHFGEETLNVLEKEPVRLMEIPGLGKKRIVKIVRSWADQKEIKNIMLFLQSHDVSTVHATKIYKTYGNESLKVVQENPYRLADDIWGIGFKTADQIAEKLGFGHERPERLRSGLLYTLGKISEEGHCYALRSMLLKTGMDLLDVKEELLSGILEEMIGAQDVILEAIPSAGQSQNSTGQGGQENSNQNRSGQNRTNQDAGSQNKGNQNEGGQNEGSQNERAIYLPPFYHAEVGVARKLLALLSHPPSLLIPKEGLLERVAQKTGLTYDTVQNEAICQAAESKVIVLTGGPGTGKTTTTLGILTACQEAGAKILLAAPTGRASKRLSEATGMEAKTIHRLLEMKPPQGYAKNDEHPLEGDVLILDECSMIDVLLMNALLKAIPLSMRLILVGDADQLPSVGAGNVFRDIAESGKVPVVRLTRIFRQAQSSRIITNAHLVGEGHMPNISFQKGSDFYFMDIENQVRNKGLDATNNEVLANEAARAVVELVATRLPRSLHVAPRDIQVLVPMQKSPVGAANLNLLIQQAINPGEEGLSRGGYLFKAGDKVMQIRNNYDKEVFNGDIGFIESVDMEERQLKVLFEDRSVSYEQSDLDELVLSYATTIHKSQGSEYPVVIMPFMMNHFAMLQRNLIYTGITRAKRALVIPGSKKALRYAVRNQQVDKRNTLLKERLEGKIIAQPQIPIEKPKMTHEQWLAQDIRVRLKDSKRRSSITLSEEDLSYLKEVGADKIWEKARSLLKQMAEPGFSSQVKPEGAPNGHPLFLAMHATGCESRKSMETWHGFPKEEPLSEKAQSYLLKLLWWWTKEQLQLSREKGPENDVKSKD